MPSTSKVDGLKITPNWPYYFKAPTVNDLKVGNDLVLRELALNPRQ